MMANEWIYWDGGECPVELGTLVDVIHRDGYKLYGQSAGVHFDELKEGDGHAYDWAHDYEQGDIIAYRLSEVG